MLSAYGHELSSRYTLRTGLEALVTLKPDWLILDNDLPDGRGWDKVDDILEDFPSLRIINISANPDSEGIIENPRVHYIRKPLEVQSILKLLN
jgi:response regulator of citrate/malate metabolism